MGDLTAETYKKLKWIRTDISGPDYSFKAMNRTGLTVTIFLQLISQKVKELKKLIEKIWEDSYYC